MGGLDFMEASEKESRYLSLEDFEKKDKESQDKIKKATSTENESTQYLYSMPPNMKRNDYHRAKMTPYAFCGGDEDSMETHLATELSELTKWSEQLQAKQWYNQVSTGEALWRKYPVTNHNEELEDFMDDDDDFEEENEELENIKEKRESYFKDRKDDLKKQYEKRVSPIQKKIKDWQEYIGKLQEFIKNEIDEEGDYFETMEQFNEAIKSVGISETFGLDAVEENLKKTMELAEEKKSEGMIAPSDIKKLLSTFQNLRKTQLDNITKNIPSDLEKERREALITVYETDFWELYEMKVREVLRKYDNKNDKPKQEEGIKFKISKLIDKIKGKIHKDIDELDEEELKDEEKLKNNVEEIIAHLDLNELFDETKNKPKGIADFEPKNQVYDLIAATLRPKDNSDDGRAEWNTYGSYYNNLKDIMDEYMEDDDDYYRSSKEKGETIEDLLPYETETDDNDTQAKEINRKTIKFTYSLFAVLLKLNGNDKNKNYMDCIFKRKFDQDNMLNTNLLNHKIFTELSKEDKKNLKDGKFGVAYEALIEECKILDGGQIVPKSRVEKLLEEFSDIGNSERGKLFYQLCTTDKIVDISKYPYKTYFDKLIRLKNLNDNDKSTDKPQEKGQANQDNA